jgi:Family of unknown function (DUF5989)
MAGAKSTGWIHRAQSRLEIAGELVRFFWSRKWWWLAPMIVALLILSALVVLAETTALSPLIYALF